MTRRTEIRGAKSPEIIKKISMVKARNVRNHDIRYSKLSAEMERGLNFGDVSFTDALPWCSEISKVDKSFDFITIVCS